MNFQPSPRVKKLLLAGGGIGLLVIGGLLGSSLQARREKAVAPVETVAKKEIDNNVRLPARAGGKNRIETVAASKVRLARDVELVGSVGFAADHFAQVGPLIAGRLVSLKRGVGDKVKAGEVLAELESADVGQAQAAYLTARAASAAAQTNLRRERELAERQVSSARERELAEAQSATEHANLVAATQRLRTLGLRPEDIREIERSANPGRVPLLTPIAGTVLKREVTLGQAVQPATDAFSVADLSRLWVLLDLFEKDLPYVHVGQRATLRTEVYPGKTFPAHVALVGHVIDEKTRTAPVRIEFDNERELFRPGQFVTATLHGDPSRAINEVMAVPRSAVLTIEGKPLLFVATDDGGFSRRPVELGVSGGGLIEVKTGIAAGERVAVDGSFLLKSELLR